METAGWSWSPVIVVELGIHAARGGDCLASGSAGVFRAYYGRVLDLAQAHAWRVVAVEIPALPFVDRYDAWDMNQIIHQEAAARGIPVATVFEPMLRCGAACLAADGHPNERGYQALAAQVEMALARSWPRLNGTWRVRR
jgi:lysophospholipase L1-like esterase